MIAALGCCRTRTSSALAVIAVSFPAVPLVESHDQLDGLVVVIARDAQLVHHALDQEEAPAARRLLVGQLRLQVWPLRGAYRRATVLVGGKVGRLRFARG